MKDVKRVISVRNGSATDREASDVFAFQVPMPLIVVLILISAYLVIAPVVSEPSIGFLLAALLILSGLLFYYPFVYRKIEWKLVGECADRSIVLCTRASPSHRENQHGLDEFLFATSSASEHLAMSSIAVLSNKIPLIHTHRTVRRQ